MREDGLLSLGRKLHPVHIPGCHIPANDHSEAITPCLLAELAVISQTVEIRLLTSLFLSLSLSLFLPHSLSLSLSLSFSLHLLSEWFGLFLFLYLYH